MTIDDELLVELFKPDRYGKIGKGALIVNVVHRKDIEYSANSVKGISTQPNPIFPHLFPSKTIVN